MVADCVNCEDKISLENVQAPTHISHGDRDGDVPYWQAEQAHEAIPNSELYTVQDGWHLLAFHPKYPDMFKA